MKSIKRNLASITLPIMAGLATLLTAAGADWPQFQGSHRDGISEDTGLLKAWPAQGPALAWKATGIGGGYAGISVVGGKVYTMGDGTDASFVYALNEADGKQLWAAKAGKAGGHSDYPGPRCTPTVDGDLIVALNQYGDLVCVAASDGREKWRKNLAEDFAGETPEWRYSESPLVDGGKVICTPGGSQGTVVALNRETGAVVWRTKDLKDKAAYSSIVKAQIGGKQQYVQLTEASVFGLDPDTGAILWRARRVGRVAVITTPIVYKDHVYVTSGYAVGCNLFKISSEGAQFKAEEVYANKNMGNHHGSVIRLGDNLYGYSEGKGWVCQDFMTGKLVWEEKGKLGKGSIAYADGRFYLRSEGSKGTVVQIEASPAGYKETGRFDQPDRSDRNSWPHPVIANGKLYLRDQDVLLCYDVKG